MNSQKKKFWKKRKTRDSQPAEENVINKVQYDGQIYSKHNYFKDVRRKIDFVLVTSILKVKEELDKLTEYILELTQQGLDFEISQGKMKSNLVFIKLHCPLSITTRIAILYNIIFDYQHPRDIREMKETWFYHKMFNNVTTQRMESHVDYSRAMFVDAPQVGFDGIPHDYRSSLSGVKLKYITSWERSLIVHKVLMNAKFGKNATDVGLSKLKAAGIIIDAYPTHDGPWQWRAKGPLTDRQLLSKYWASFTCMFKNQPLNLIYKYYGPELTFYFAFIDYWTKMLTIPAAFGVLCFVGNAIIFSFIDVSRVDEVCHSKAKLCALCSTESICHFNEVSDQCYVAYYSTYLDNIIGIVFAIVISVWGTNFLAAWHRREFLFKFHWNLMNAEWDQTLREEFLEKATYTRIGPETGDVENYVPVCVKTWKYIYSLLCCVLMIGIIFASLVISIYSQSLVLSWINESKHLVLRQYEYVIVIFVTALVSLILVQTLTPCIRLLSIHLTREENPPAELDFYKSCIYKFYLLSFVNNYLPLFYQAFLKGAFYTYPGTKVLKTIEFRNDVCPIVGCSVAVTIYLINFIGLKSFFVPLCRLTTMGLRNMMVVLRGPHFRKSNEREQKGAKHVPAWERDYALIPDTGLFSISSFLDVSINYGFVLFFISTFPLTPLMVVLSNVIHIRLEAREILRNFRRPVAKLMPGIGAWNSIFHAVTFIGAMTNSFVIAFTSVLLDIEMYRYSNGHLRGFLNSTLSVFDTNDYPAEFRKVVHYANVSTCVYHGRRQPFTHREKYQLTELHWKHLFAKLCFVLIFQQFIWVINVIWSSSMLQVSEEILEELTDEAIRLRDERYETARSQYKVMDKGDLHPYQIE